MSLYRDIYTITIKMPVKQHKKNVSKFAKIKAARAARIARYKNNKGNYPYPWNNLLDDTTGTDMIHLSPESVNLEKLDDMRDKRVSLMETLVEKFNYLKQAYLEDSSKKKMTEAKYLAKYIRKADMLKIENYLRTQKRIQDDDLENLVNYGLVHQPITALGKTIKIMEYLKKFHLEDKPNATLPIYLRLMENEFKVTLEKYPKLMDKFIRSIKWMNDYVDEQDMVKYQLVTKHEMMPPLNQKGFVKLDTWQEQAIDLMRERKSTILSIPTSGGKTYLSAYLTKSKGKIWFLAPSIPLARQVAAYFTRVTDSQVPYMTDTYQPHLYHKEMMDCLEKSKVIVSTPDIFLDFLPELGTLGKEDNLIIDEIHMMGSNQGDSMEMFAILNNQAMLLGLSATVSNPDDLITWRRNMGDDLTVISSKERFFNLQTSYWDTKTKETININPLAMLSLEDFISEKVLVKDMKPTPPDVYQLAEMIEDKFGEEMGTLNLKTHFDDLHSRRVNLLEVMDYFQLLIEFMVKQTKTTAVSKIEEILSEFTPVDLDEEETNLMEIITHLRDTKNIPVLVFQRNTYSLMRLAKKVIEQINQAENKEYPERLKEIERQEKEAKRRKKEMEKLGLLSQKDCGLSKGKTEKDKAEISRIEKARDKAGLEEIYVEHIQRPTPKFNWCPNKYISEAEIYEIDQNLKKYFPHNGDYYHPIIHALWRGIGIYAEGLPDDYLVLVQVMANEKKLGVVLSDKSMTFGVSMPFRNVVIYRDPTTDDDLNPLLFKQMEGRAGRRGQDTKGSVIFAGYSWNRIEELSISEIPRIKGQNAIENIYLPIGAKLAQVSGRDIDFTKVFTHNLSRLQNPSEEEYASWDEYLEMWQAWTPKAMDGDKDLLRMLWKSRNFGCDGVTFYHLVGPLEKYFSGGDIGETRQVNAGHILAFFIQNKKATRKSEILEKPRNYTNWKLLRHSLLEMGLPLEDENYLDGRIAKSIKMNHLFEGHNDREYQEIREDFFKFACSLRILQNYCYYTKRVTLTKILGKLFTRCKWILWLSSPLSNFGKEQIYLKELDDDEFLEGDVLDDEVLEDDDDDVDLMA